MARRGAARDLAVGAVFSLALVILAATIMAVGEGSKLFADKASYSVIFVNADGLVQGSPVKMSGVVVGSVTGIRLSRDPGASGIEVEIGIDRAFVARVREDSQATLRILQLLSGEKFVEVIPGSPERELLAEGSMIETAQGQALLEQAEATAENLNEITISLRNILHKLESGDGLMGQMISDPDFGQEAFEALGEAFINLEAISYDLRQGRGVVGRLLRDEDFATKLEDVLTALQQAAQMVESVDPTKGGLGAFLSEDGPGQRAIEDFAVSAAALRRITQSLDDEQGIAGQLFQAAEGPDTFAEDLRRLVANLAAISDKINSGEGTLGALVNDRAVYDGMQDIVAGANSSTLGRWLMRHYQKSGIEAGAPDSGSPDPGREPDPGR
jgi:phospholipid/cholesterol/gamma-HCH transport system substrate-binding protein